MRKAIVTVLMAVVITVAVPVVSAPVYGTPVTLYPGQLTVGVSLPSQGFETGIANGAHVIYAQGLDIDLALAIAKSLGLRRVQFVQSSFSNLLSAGKKPWDIAVAQITITSARSRNLTFSQPYMTVDQGVLAAKGVSPVPTSLAGLRSLQLCALLGSTGADVAKNAHRTVQARFAGDERSHPDAGPPKQRVSGHGLRRAVSRCDEVAGAQLLRPVCRADPDRRALRDRHAQGEPDCRAGGRGPRRTHRRGYGPTAGKSMAGCRPGQVARTSLTAAEEG